MPESRIRVKRIPHHGVGKIDSGNGNQTVGRAAEYWKIRLGVKKYEIHIVHKAFWDFEKEEQWLNTMSARGLALSDYSWCRYVFADTPENRYIYRIELLENLPTHPESMAYLRFLEENGVECVASYMRWVYLRKNASEGPFDIYTDIDSRRSCTISGLTSFGQPNGC